MARPPKHPWDEIRAKYETGQFDQAGLIKQYGVDSGALSRKIKKDGWVVNQKAIQAIRGFDEVNQNLSDLSDKPLLHEATLEEMSKLDPTLMQLVFDANKAVMTQAKDTAGNVFGADLNATAKAVQTCSDSLGITQRHAPRAETNVNVQNNVVANGDAVADALKRKYNK